MTMQLSTILWACAGGFLPALFWLWFWLKEDEHPEPHKIIFYAFLGGMLMVFAALFLEGWAKEIVEVNPWSWSFFISGKGYAITSGFILVVVWAAIEEILKLGAAFVSSLVRKEDDEPIDPAIYLMATAIGFAALENVLFIINPLQAGDLSLGILTGNIRFIGSTLLHLLSSAIIGVCVGLVFYRSLWTKFSCTILGLILAIALHTTFNLLIIHVSTMTFALLLVWISIIVLALFFEKLKNISPNN